MFLAPQGPTRIPDKPLVQEHTIIPPQEPGLGEGPGGRGEGGFRPDEQHRPHAPGLTLDTQEGGSLSICPGLSES